MCDVQSRNQTIAIHILSDTSRNKDNRTIKFVQLTANNFRNIFLEKSFRKRGEETIPKHFSKKIKLTISLLQ